MRKLDDDHSQQRRHFKDHRQFTLSDCERPQCAEVEAVSEAVGNLQLRQIRQGEEIAIQDGK